MVRIVCDAMGGDRAPDEVIAGSRLAAEREAMEIILVGLPEVRRRVPSVRPPSRIAFLPAADVVGMEESPSKALREKKDSSLARGLRYVKEGRADAFFSAGNTGAIYAFAMAILGRLRPELRPALSLILPIRDGVVLIDIGANAECRPEHYVQFGVMGSVLSRIWLGVEEPKVGLLNIGEEPTKGARNLQAAYDLLAKSPLHFVGNVEGDTLFEKEVDVVVCDGQTGNIVVKFGEGAALFLFGKIKEAFLKDPYGKLLGLLVKARLKKLKSSLGYESFGCVPLVGMKRVVTIGHGKSDREAVMTALLKTKQLLEEDLLGRLDAGLASLGA